jgi:transcription-repair coupling factor (superfamily II helicase)
MRLLEEAVLEVKGEAEVKPPDPELQLNLAASIPESYIPEATMRLTLYKRLSSAVDREELDILGEEIEDRFGRLPESVTHLLQVMQLKQQAQRVWLKSLRLRDSQAVLAFDARSPVDPQWLVQVFQKEPKRFRWLSQQEMAVQLKVKEGGSPLEALEQFLKEIQIIDS